MAVCMALPSQHRLRRESTRAIHRRFQGTEWRSVPLPLSPSLSRFGTVSCKTYWQALAGLSWLSFSQPADLPLVPGPVRPGIDCLQSKAPHASQVERSQRPRTPWTGLLPIALMSITRFEHAGLQFAMLRTQAFPHRPLFLTRLPLYSSLPQARSSRAAVKRPPAERNWHRIECRDYSACDGSANQRQRASQMQDYSDKPPSNWTSQSPGIQLYGPIT